ncbi:hypothetical protein BH23BAC2_BH23BAC2_00320 [soil metagenome]
MIFKLLLKIEITLSYLQVCSALVSHIFYSFHLLIRTLVGLTA